MRTEFDYSMMSAFLNCRRKYNLRYNRGLVSQVSTLPLAFGGCIHQALDSWHTKRDVEKAVSLFHEKYKEDLERDDKRTNAMGEWIIRNYAVKYAVEPFEIVASEQPFDLPLPNGNKFIGRIDKIIKWDGIFWVMDHKTTSELGANFFKMAEPNMQFTGYVWAARQLGYPAVGVLLDTILVAKGLLKAETRARLTPLARYDAYRSDAQLEEWYSHVTKIQRDIRTCEEFDDWYPNYDMCTYYGECTYRRVCKEEPSLHEKIIEDSYVVEHWDPREERK